MYFDSSNGYNSFYVVPRRDIGAGSVAVSNISTITGIGTNLTAAQNLLGDLSGSLTDWTQAFNSAGGKNPTYIPGEPMQRLAPARVQRLLQGRLEGQLASSR